MSKRETYEAKTEELLMPIAREATGTLERISIRKAVSQSMTVSR